MTDGAAGLEDANKIIFFPSSFKTTFGFSGVGAGLQVWCFFDGSIARNHASNVFCSGGNSYAALIDTSSTNQTGHTNCNGPKKDFELNAVLPNQSWTSTTGPVSGGGYYYGYVCYYEGEAQHC
ncbi:MAG: hypothetical protein WAV00_17360 [Nocardioides sp.]